MTAPAVPQRHFPALWLGTAASGMRSFAAGQPVTIGSHPGCHLVVPHPSVAPVHLVVSAGPYGWVVADQGAPWGTWASGGRVQQAFSLGGDVDLRVGDPAAGLTVRLHSDPLPTAAPVAKARSGRGHRLAVALLALVAVLAGALALTIHHEIAAASEAAESAPAPLVERPAPSGTLPDAPDVEAPRPAPAPPRALESLPTDPKLLPAGAPGLYDGLYRGEGPGPGLVALLDTIYRDVHAYWGSVFADAGLAAPTANPIWLGAGEVVETGCRGEVGEFGGFDDRAAAYCGANDGIGIGLPKAADYWSGNHSSNQDYGAELAAGEFSLVLLMAHEYGHNLQWELGLEVSDAASEAHADCLAGVWIGVLGRSGRTTERDLEEVGGSLARMGDHDHGSPHGTPDERYAAFRLGYDGGSIHACTPLLAR